MAIYDAPFATDVTAVNRIRKVQIEQEYAMKEFISAVDLMLESGLPESKIKKLFTEVMFQRWVDSHEVEEGI